MKKTGSKRIRPAAVMACLGFLGLHGGAAHAQVGSLLIQPAIPYDYDRGRNISVAERARPDYDPLGIPVGGFIALPRIDAGIGASNNIYLSSLDKQGDAYALLAPSVQLNSDWSRHQLSLSTGGRFRRYFDNVPRNQNEWFVNGLGRVDLGSSYALTLEGQLARTQEEPFSGDTESTIAALSSYRRNYVSARGEYRNGRIRGVLSYDYQHFAFSTIETSSGASISQANRDRDISRIAGQLEYALSPSLAVYGQLNYLTTDYDTDLSPGVANRDSTSLRAIAGISVDISGFFRGQIGAGYSERNYKSPLYRDVSGLSVEGQLEYFPTELTTFTLSMRRAIEDSNVGVTSAYFDNRISLRVDHELLSNLILTGSVDYARQNYIGLPDKDNIWKLRASGRYLMTRTFSLQPDFSYSRRARFGGSSNFSLDELAGVITAIIRY
jgi:hypothetical protein